MRLWGCFENFINIWFFHRPCGNYLHNNNYNITDECDSWRWYQARVKARGHYETLSATLLLQLHFNSFPDAHLVPDEVILCNIETLLLSSVWCAFIREGVEVHLLQQSCTENRIEVWALNKPRQVMITHERRVHQLALMTHDRSLSNKSRRSV